jgi:hypothetical protein
MGRAVVVLIGVSLLGGGCSNVPNTGPEGDPKDVVQLLIRNAGRDARSDSCSAVFFTIAELEERREIAGKRDCRSTIPRRLATARVVNVVEDSDAATVVLAQQEMPFSETVDPPALVWAIDELDLD